MATKKTPPLRAVFLLAEGEIAAVFAAAGEDVVVVTLFPVDVVDAGVDLAFLGVELGEFVGEHSFAFGDGGDAGLAEVEISFHFLDTEATALETGEALDPLDGARGEGAVVVFVATDIGDEAFVAIKFKGVVGEAGGGAGFFHSEVGGHKFSFSSKKCLTGSNSRLL